MNMRLNGALKLLATGKHRIIISDVHSRHRILVSNFRLVLTAVQ